MFYVPVGKKISEGLKLSGLRIHLEIEYFGYSHKMAAWGEWLVTNIGSGAPHHTEKMSKQSWRKRRRKGVKHSKILLRLNNHGLQSSLFRWHWILLHLFWNAVNQACWASNLSCSMLLKRRSVSVLAQIMLIGEGVQLIHWLSQTNQISGKEKSCGLWKYLLLESVWTSTRFVWRDRVP